MMMVGLLAVTLAGVLGYQVFRGSPRTAVAGLEGRGSGGNLAELLPPEESPDDEINKLKDHSTTGLLAKGTEASGA